MGDKVGVVRLFLVGSMAGSLFASMYAYEGSLRNGYSIDDQKWSWAHRYHLSLSERMHATLKGVFHFHKGGVAPFTQLIPSWNSTRPSKGHYAVYVRVRDAATHEWDQWLHVAYWGERGQRSYGMRGNFSSFHYARLEMNKGRKADAFELKIEAHEGASLERLQLVAVSTSDKELFQPESYSKRVQQLRSVYITEVPQISQMNLPHKDAGKICSPTAITVLSGAFFTLHNPLKTAEQVYDHGLSIYGNWMFNTAQAYLLCRERIFFYPVRLADFSALHALLVQGIPVVVSIRGTLTGAAKSFPGGHLLVVVGWNARSKKVVCHDSAFKNKEDIEVEYDLYEFIAAWELSQRLVYKPLFE